jgi:hypothetical protein
MQIETQKERKKENNQRTPEVLKRLLDILGIENPLVVTIPLNQTVQQIAVVVEILQICQIQCLLLEVCINAHTMS